MKKYLFGFLIVLLLMGLSLFYIISQENNYYDSACNTMRSIASNKEKIVYLEGWVNSKINNQQFLESLGTNRRISLDNGVAELVPKIDIDLEFLGIKNEASYVSFNRLYKDYDQSLDGSKINSFGVGSGRFGIIINLNSSESLGLEWPSEKLNKIEKVTNKVSIVCGI